jgi:hypothetical protein
MDSTQIDQHFADDSNYKGIHWADDVPLLKQGEYVVINIDADKTHGTHWVGLYAGKQLYCYFDSFGFMPAKKLKQPTIYNDKQLQKLTQDNCGQWVIAFLDHMRAGKSYASFLQNVEKIKTLI